MATAKLKFRGVAADAAQMEVWAQLDGQGGS